MCAICGQPGFVRCNCQSAQPFCDQCDNNSVCIEKVDSGCVIYHFATPGYIPPATRLINLNMPNGSSAEAIFEKIDTMFGLGSRPWTSGNTPSLDLSLDTTVSPSVLTGVVNISPDAGNIISIHANGLFASTTAESGKVRVSAVDPLLFLEDAMFGGTDGCVSLSIERDTVSGRLFLQPSLSAPCLFQNFFSAEDTTSIHLDLNLSGTPVILTASSKISATAGNVLTVNADGLYVPTPSTPPAGLTAANNGLSVTGGNTVQLGGPLIKNTNVSYGNAFTLSLTGRPHTYFGDGTPGTNALIQVDNTYQAAGFSLGMLATTTAHLGTVGMIGVNGNIIAQSGTDTDHSIKAGLYGQIFFNDGATETLSGFPEVAYTGVVGLVTMYTAGGAVSGTDTIAGVTGGAFGGDNVSATNVAALQAKTIYQAPQGAAYSGTITNYYGLLIEDIAGGLGSHITNKYSIFQRGTTGLNVFSTAATVSDVRKKDNIVDFEKGLAEVEQLRVVQFNYKDSTPDDKKVGVIAQEVEVVLPEAIHTRPIDDLEDFKLVESNAIFYTMLNAIKALSAQNKALNTRILALEGKA